MSQHSPGGLRLMHSAHFIQSDCVLVSSVSGLVHLWAESLKLQDDIIPRLHLEVLAHADIWFEFVRCLNTRFL